MTLPLYHLRKNPRYPLDRRLVGTQSRSGRYGEIKILDPTGIQLNNTKIISENSVEIQSGIISFPSSSFTPLHFLPFPYPFTLISRFFPSPLKVN
jgi:hypothetical protein